MHVPPMYTKLDLGNRPTAVKRSGREVYSGYFTFQLSKRRIYRSIQYKYMHVTPDLGEFFFSLFFLFSRARLHPLSLQGCCRVTMWAKPSKLSQCEILIFDKKEPGTCRDLPFMFPFFLPIFLLDFSSKVVVVSSITCSSDDINNNKVMSPPIYLEPYSETTGT